MNNTIRKEVFLPHPPSQVWPALTTRDALADWMYPNDFEPRVGHAFTFRVPPNPAMDFEGLTVHCEVLTCDAPNHLVFSWSVGGPVVNTRVSFRLEPEGNGTRLFFEHTGFDLSQPGAEQAFHGATYGWAKMLGDLSDVLARPHSALRTARTLPASPRRIFAAFEQPDQLSRWWGPKDFTNTFTQFEFTPGGRWVFVMHGPDGADYANECVFREIQPDARIVIEHVVQPWFRLTLTLAPQAGQTRLDWIQEFENPETATALRAICEPSNEQNLDRLQALLANENP